MAGGVQAESFGASPNDTGAIATGVSFQDDIIAGWYTPTLTGTLDSMRAYIWCQTPGHSTDTPTRGIVRRANNTIVDTTYVTNIPSHTGYNWRTLIFINGVTVKADTAYWIGIWSDSLGESGDGYYSRIKRSAAGEYPGDSVAYRLYDFANEWATTESWTGYLNDYFLCVIAYYTVEGEPEPSEASVYLRGAYLRGARLGAEEIID